MTNSEIVKMFSKGNEVIAQSGLVYRVVNFTSDAAMFLADLKLISGKHPFHDIGDILLDVPIRNSSVWVLKPKLAKVGHPLTKLFK